MAALFMAAGMAILWVMGNPYLWTGAIGGLAAVAIRGWYLMDEALAEGWTLDATGLRGPGGRNVPITQIEKLRRIGSAVQVVTRSGDKHLIKYVADTDAVIATIDAARR
jgi:hypothetical protein